MNDPSKAQQSTPKSMSAQTAAKRTSPASDGSESRPTPDGGPGSGGRKEIDREAGEAAKIAARRAGMSVDAWLTQAVLAAATQQLKRSVTGHPGRFYPRHEQDEPSRLLPTLDVGVVRKAISDIATLQTTLKEAQQALEALTDRVGALEDQVKRHPKIDPSVVPRVRRLEDQMEVQQDRLVHLAEGGETDDTRWQQDIEALRERIQRLEKPPAASRRNTPSETPKKPKKYEKQKKKGWLDGMFKTSTG